MAAIYCWSGGDNSTGADWAHAKTTLSAAAIAVDTGTAIYVAHDQNETANAAITINLPGTSAAPNNVVCVNRSGSVPPIAADLRTTAVISVGAANAALTINGYAQFYGITFNGGTNNNATCSILLAQTAANKQVFRSCALALPTASGSAAIAWCGASNTYGEVVLDNTTLSFANATQNIQGNGRLIWRNTTSAYLGTVVSNLFVSRIANAPYSLLVEGVDLSSFSGNLVYMNNGVTAAQAIFKDCKLHASATFNDTPTTTTQWGVDGIRCDTGSAAYKLIRNRYEGSMSTDTVTVRSGGATDGVTPISWKIVTTANAGFFNFQFPPIRIWNETITGNVNVTMYGAGAATPNQTDLWFDVEYLASDSAVNGTFATGGPVSGIETAVAWTTDSTSTWAGSPAAKFKQSVTIAPRQKGYIYIYLRAAKASSTYYIDPKPVLS